MKIGSNDVKQGFVLSLVLFKIIDTVLDEGIKCMLVKDVEVINLGERDNAVVCFK